jgi:hypothetical protein
MMIPRTPQFRLRVLASLTLAAAAVLTSGCYSEGGLGWSEDQYVYISRVEQPWTVSLKDTRTGDEIWSVEVPVGKQLVVHFLPGAGAPNAFTPDLMEWGLMEPGTETARLGNSLPVPPAEARLLAPTLRPVPEYSPEAARKTIPKTGGL